MKHLTTTRISRELIERLIDARGMDSTAANRNAVTRELRATRSAYHQVLVTKSIPFFGTKVQATLMTIAEVEAEIAVLTTADADSEVH